MCWEDAVDSHAGKWDDDLFGDEEKSEDVERSKSRSRSRSRSSGSASPILPADLEVVTPIASDDEKLEWESSE